MPGDFVHWVFLLCMLVLPVVAGLLSISNAIRAHTQYLTKRDYAAARDREAERREDRATRPPDGYNRS